METLRDRLVRHEGIRLRPYADSLGKMTIGIGRCLSTEGISQEEAYMLLENDIDNLKNEIPDHFEWFADLDSVRQDVVTEMCFQLGISGVNKFPNMLDAIERGDYPAAAKEMLNSAWHTQTPARCEELANLMLHGESQ